MPVETGAGRIRMRTGTPLWSPTPDALHGALHRRLKTQGTSPDLPYTLFSATPDREFKFLIL